MPHNNSPPPFIGLLGAIIALGVVRGVNTTFGVNIEYFVGLAAVITGVVVGIALGVRYVYQTVRAWHESKVWYEQLDSRVVSAFYRYRAKVLSHLGLIGR